MENEEWIEWEGGECPVDPDTRVDIKFNNGKTNNALTAEFWVWEHLGFDAPYDIIAYRIIDHGN